MKKILTLILMVSVWVTTYAQTPQWIPFDSGTTFTNTNELNSFKWRGDSYISEYGTGNLWKITGNTLISVPSPGFGIVSAADFNDQLWAIGNSTIAAFDGTIWDTKKTVSGYLSQILVGNDDLLYVGGLYTSDNGIENIMKTDGVIFAPLDSNEVVGQVTALIISPFTENLQICQAVGAPSDLHISEWNYGNYVPLNQPSSFGIGEVTLYKGNLWYFMTCVDPNDPDSGYGNHLMMYDGTNWVNKGNIYGDIDVLYPDDSSLLFSYRGDITYSDGTVVSYSGLAQYIGDGNVPQIGEDLYGGIISIIKNDAGVIIVTGWFGPTYGAPLHADVLMYTVLTGNVDAVETENLAGVTLFPNPTSDVIHISGLSSQKSNIEILDITGRTVALLTSGSPDFIVDVSNLSNGMYFIKLPNESLRFIKNN